MWDDIFNLIYNIINNILIKMDNIRIIGVSFLDFTITIFLISIMIRIFVARSKERV